MLSEGNGDTRALICALVTLFSVGLADTTDAQAAGLPSINIDQSCASVANPEACKTMEQRARAKLQSIWQSLDPERQEQCAALGIANQSYVAALSCAT